MFISISKEFEDYDFAVFNSKRTLNLTAGARSLTLKPGDTFGYRSARNSVYIVMPERGLTYEYKITEDDFDRRIAPKADEVKPAKAKKLFTQKEAPKKAPVKVKPVAPSKPRTGARSPVKVTPSIPVPEHPPILSRKQIMDQELLANFGNADRFARIKTTSDAIGYTAEVWKKVNAKKCGGRLKQPTFSISKDMGHRVRTLGRWSPSRRAIILSPRLFKAKELIALTTIVHEIAHEAVTDINGIAAEPQEQGHGPIWAAWMSVLGLDPHRFAQHDRMEYFDEDEKEELQRKRKDYQEKLEQREAERAGSGLRSVLPAPNRLAQVYSVLDKKWLKGMIAYKNDQAGKRWAMVLLEGAKGSFKIIPSDWFHELPREEFTDAQFNELTERSAIVSTYLQRKHAVRSVTRSRRF